VVRGNYVYALTHRKGVQVVDMRKAEENYTKANTPPYGVNYWKMTRDLNSDGQGFGFDAIVSHAPFPGPPQQPARWRPQDQDVGDYTINGRTEPVVFFAADSLDGGECPLVVGSPVSSAILKSYNVRVPDVPGSPGVPAIPGFDLCTVRLAVGKVHGRDV